MSDLYNSGFLKDTIWYILLVLLFFTLTWFVVIKFVFPFLKNKKWIQFVITLLISIFFLLMTLLTSTNYLSLQNEYLECLDVFKNSAKEEIENDLINLEYFGVGEIVTSPKIVDSISKSYGVRLKPVRDVYYNVFEEKARDKYYEKPIRIYLDERNGVGWEKRMDEALRPYIIDLIKK